MDSPSFYARTRSAELEPKKKYQPHELLVMLRQRSGLSKSELAGLLGLSSERMLQKWEGGYTLPPAERLRRLIEIYHAKNVFLAGKELEEVRLLWNTIQNFYDATHPSYEGYPVFDAAWFDKLFKEHTKVNLRVLPPKAAAPEPPPPKPAPMPEDTTTPATNLSPLELTKFIGRQKELGDIGRLLTEEKHRLITLCGTGGIGKTRLAVQAVRPLVANFKDGVWLVELAALSSTEELALAVAKALDLVNKSPAKDLLTTLQKQLKTKQLLLVLDNCEHLLRECAELAASLLTSCAGLQILTTSRERLGILGELVLPLSPLTFPATNAIFSQSALLEFEAVQLFCDRAWLIEPDFVLNEQNLTALAQICQKLDGIPLALELAAVRVSVLSLEQINQRLADRFKLLTKGNRTALPRHQTLQTLLDWSFRLLTVQEQTLLRRLAVFSGSWTLEAVEAVCNSSDLPAAEILDNLSGLVAKSLVVADRHEQITRYHMLQTIYEYASEHFASAKDAALYQERPVTDTTSPAIQNATQALARQQ